MPVSGEGYQAAAAADPAEGGVFPPRLPTDRPTSARTYSMALGSKDNFAVDREFVRAAFSACPEFGDLARENRLFLRRAVRFLVAECGIRQFLDLGCGLPCEINVHDTVQEHAADARVVYVDNDPIVTAHCRALLGDGQTTAAVQGDITRSDEVFALPEVRELIDPHRPVGLLLFSTCHCVPDDAAVRALLTELVAAMAPGSYLALSHLVADDDATAAAISELVSGLGLPWRVRTRATLAEWLGALRPVPPGLTDVHTWRPDPTQKPLPEAHPLVQPFLGVPRENRRTHEYGGVLRKP